MAAANYSPPAEALIKATRADFDRRDVVLPVHLVQYDATLPVLAVALYKGGQPWTLPTGADVNLRMDKKDGHYVYNPALGVSSDRSTVYMAVTAQMTTGYGTFSPMVEVMAGGGVAGMAALRLDIDKNPVQDGMLESTDEYKSVQVLAAEVAANAKIVRDNEAGIQDVHDNIEVIKAAPANAKAAADSAKEARSWAVGDTASRPGEGMDNAKYYAALAQQVSQGAVGWYPNYEALYAAHDTGYDGNWAIIGDTDTIWVWDSDTLSPGLYTLPKGGVEHDRAKHGGSMPVQDRRLPMHREPHASCCELARHKLGTPTGPDADGGQRHLPRGQRGRRGTAYAHCVRDSVPSASAPRMGNPNRIRPINAICTNLPLRQVRQHSTYDPSSG